MEQAARPQVWVGIDVGKGHHWAVAVDENGTQLWSKKIFNDEAAILEAIGEALQLAAVVKWAVDISGTSSALLHAPEPFLSSRYRSAIY